jgi:predicted RecA/RadA family phage recombinase
MPNRNRIHHGSYGFSYVVDVSANLATILPINVADYRTASVQIGEALTLTIYGCNKEDPTGETFVAASSSTPAAKAVAGGAAGVFDLPDISANRWIKITAGKEATVHVFLKA